MELFDGFFWVNTGAFPKHVLTSGEILILHVAMQDKGTVLG